MKNTSSIVVASTLGATFAAAAALTFWEALDPLALLSAALIGGGLGALFQRLISDPKACFAWARHVTVGSARLAAFIAPQLLVTAILGFVTWSYVPLRGSVFVSESFAEDLASYFGLLARMAPLTTLFVLLVVLGERRPLAFFQLADRSSRARALVGRAGIFRKFVPPPNFVLVGRAPAWKTQFRSKRIKFADYLAAGVSCAALFGLSSAFVVLLMGGMDLGLLSLVRHGYGPVVSYVVAVPLGLLLAIGLLRCLVISAWSGVTLTAATLRQRASLCSGTGAALGSVAGLLGAACFHLWGVPLVATLLGSLGGALCGLLVIGVSELVYRFAARYTPGFVPA